VNRAAETHVGVTKALQTIAVSDGAGKARRLGERWWRREVARLNPHGWHQVYSRDAVFNFLIKTKLLATDKGLRAGMRLSHKLETVRTVGSRAWHFSCGERPTKLRRSLANHQQNDIQRLSVFAFRISKPSTLHWTSCG
jgi:hypothetical protein